ncbi:MAG TPA: glycoside hydrolase family 2 TIM barrel-domain containing protein, partial [Candidatus Goldiibacteriota bacterium]|nr:glycoside hydrolase family 2 TIM barrel-domain containing protein [Candidatus Goldiibacteriota bacterium]
TRFGIRKTEFTENDGFYLNGKRVAIKGVCLHHDNGYLGSAFHRRAAERQIEIMKRMGANAIRTSHNPPATQLLDLCDEMGMLVMDEAFDEWKENKTVYGYRRFFDEWAEKDLMTMLHRDRNHPCIILWSIGNEIAEQWQGDADDAGKRTKWLTDICHREDGTRPVTAAFNNVNQAIEKGMGDGVDVFGINYSPWAYKTLKGKRKLIATETASDVSSRGEYNLVIKDGKAVIEPTLNNQCTSYDIFAPGWACPAYQSLQAIMEAPWVYGEFVWTGFDYIGEPTPFWWPSVISYFGIVDLCGFPKDRYYLYKSRWTDEPMVHVLPHWNHSGFENMEIPVFVYTKCESVELFLNGESLGEKKMS